MNDNQPFICRKIYGLRPGQWLIVIGITMILISHIATNTPLRLGQWLIVIGGIGFVIFRSR